MFYKSILENLTPIFNLNYEEKKLYRPEGVKNWGFSEYSDEVYEICVSFLAKDNSASFRYWVRDENRNIVYKKAVKKLFYYMKFVYVIKIKKWLK